MMEFGYYVEKANSQDCTLTKVETGNIRYNLKSNVSGAFVKFNTLAAISDTLNHDSRFQKAESHIPRVF